jgi:hypothetical protein
MFPPPMVLFVLNIDTSKLWLRRSFPEAYGKKEENINLPFNIYIYIYIYRHTLAFIKIKIDPFKKIKIDIGFMFSNNYFTIFSDFT